MKRFVAIVLALVIMISSIPAVYAEDTIVSVNLSRQLMVDGNKIVYLDDPGTMVRLAGINIPSLEWGDKGEHIFESLTEGCDGWNANIVRLPLSPTRWFDETNGANYQNIVKEVAEGVQARGKYLLLDCHTYVMPTQEVYDFWMDVCDKYGNNPTILFGLCNEPHDIKGVNEDESKSQWELWRNGGMISYNGEATVGIGHQQLVEAIRDKGAKNILVAGGLGWGYDLSGIANGYALIDQGSDGDTSKTGYGIMYDSHIYPSKGLEDSWNRAAGCVRSFAPLLIGEMGWDPEDGNISNDTSVYNLWMPQLLDWIDDKDGQYGVPANWTAWCFHPSASPRVITSWQYIPTYFNGVYVKERLLSYPDTGFYSDRVYENTFEPDMFTGYTPLTKGSETGKSAKVNNGALDLNFKRSADSHYVGYSMNLPSDWCLEGLQTIELDVTPKASAINSGMSLEVGFRGSDTELWGKNIPLEDTNTKHVIIKINELENLAPVIKSDDKFTYGIIGFYVGAGKSDALVRGDVTIDNVKFTMSANPVVPMPAPYVRQPNNPQYLFDNDSDATLMTVKKNDNGPGSGQGDYFKTTVEEGVGYEGSTGIHVTYNRINGIWGGFSQLTYPTGSDFADAQFASFMLKGNGVQQQMSIKIGSATKTLVLPAGDTDWHQYVIRLSQHGCMDPENIQYFEFHADNKLESELWADNIQITKDYPQIIVPAENVILENGFEDSLITFNAKNTDSATVTGSYYDGGFNSQRGYQLKFDGNDATAELKTPKDWNLSAIDTFTFDAKVLDKETADIELGLLDKVGIAAYTGNKHTLTNEWQRFTVPMFDYKLNGVAIVNSRIQGLHIKADDAIVLIDNITFSNCEVEPPVAHAVNYLNTFDEDVYGEYISVGGDETNYINASVQSDVGYDGAGLVFDFAGNQSGKAIDITGFPTEWDFSKAKYAHFMVKGNNPDGGNGYHVNGNSFAIEWYYDYVDDNGAEKSVKTAVVDFDAHRNVWSNIIAPIVPKTSNGEYLKNTNRIRFYSKRNMTGSMIIDNLGFYDMKPDRVVPEGKAVFTESFDNSSMLDVKFSGGYYTDQDNYLHVNDGGGKSHWGITMQSAHQNLGLQNPPSGTDYIQATLPMSWELFRTTHMTFDARLCQSWRTKDFSLIFTGLPEGGLTETTMTISLLDEDMNEYSQQVYLDNKSYQTYTIPLTGFVNDGEAVDLTKVKYIRLYADANLTQSGFNMDNLSFVTETPTVTSLTVTNNGQPMMETLVGGKAEVTCTIDGAGVPLLLGGALYQGDMLVGLNLTKSSDVTITTDLDIPTELDNNTLKVFVWDATSMTELENGYLCIN